MFSKAPLSLLCLAALVAGGITHAAFLITDVNEM